MAVSCKRCGSWSVKRDRSLGGRLVCGRCGNPLVGGRRHQRAGVGPQRRRRALPSLQGRLWVIVVLGLIGAGALLAMVYEGPPHRFQPLRRDRGPSLLS